MYIFYSARKAILNTCSSTLAAAAVCLRLPAPCRLFGRRKESVCCQDMLPP